MPRGSQVRLFDDGDVASLIKKAKNIMATEPKSSAKYKQAAKFMRENSEVEEVEGTKRVSKRSEKGRDDSSTGQRKKGKPDQEDENETSESEPEEVPTRKIRTAKRGARKANTNADSDEEKGKGTRKQKITKRKLEEREEDSESEEERPAPKRQQGKKQKKAAKTDEEEEELPSDESEDDPFEPAPKAGTSKKAKRKEEDDDEEEVEYVSEDEDSQKRWRLVKKSVVDKKIGKKKPFQMIQKNYAPHDLPDKNHKYFFRAHIGAGYYVSVAKWVRNKMNYIQIRKSSVGANVPVANYQYLKQAILDIEKHVPEEYLTNEKNEGSD